MDTVDALNELIIQKIVSPDGRINPKYKIHLKKHPGLTSLIMSCTNYLQYEASLKVRLQCIIQNITEQPTCSVCGQITKMRETGKFVNTFPSTCGSKCFSSLNEVKRKRKHTNQLTYGGNSPTSSPTVREKSKQTNLKKYGVDNVFKSKSIQHKISETIKEKYGSDEKLKEHNKTKRIKTLTERYGETNAMHVKDFKEKQQQTVQDRYNVRNVWLDPNIQKKAKETMVNTYGVLYPLQHPEIKKKFELTMLNTHGAPYLSLVGKEKALNKLKDKDWLGNEYTSKHKTAVKIATELEVAPSTALKYLHYHDIDIITHNTSQIERDVAKLIQDMLPLTNIITNDRTIIAPHELDIFIPDYKLAFEINGTFWHSELNGKSKQYHLNKTQQCSKQGIRLIHILDREFMLQQPIVISRINNLLGLSQRIYARKCKIVTPSSSQVRTFCNTTHIQGYAPSSIDLGLQYEDELVAVMTFAKSRYNKKIDYELVRYSNKLNTSVVGGASKLFSHFIKTHTPTSVISYADMRWNTGNMYTQLGFELTNLSPPNYKYFKPENSFKVFPRETFQKHKLESKLGTFDPAKTEWENMQANGYDRIWDCGNSVYTWFS